ncbi:MAG: energy transducer TonB [Candidatus Sulfotelmatobacter sp.]
MTETLQLEEVTHLHDAPKLLVEWTPRWQEFTTSIRPAFARSGARLAGEAPHGIFPYRGMIAWYLLQLFLLFAVIVVPREIDRLRPYAPPRIQPNEVIYYSADELPRTEDLGGAQSGASGRAGGQEAHHRTQTIKVARGVSLAPKVVDAPDLKLPSSPGAVANLLAFKSVPGPPPAEGLHSSLTAPSLPANVIAPAPANIARDQSRSGLTLNSVVPPAPNVSAERSRSAPALNAAIVAPAPSAPSEHTLFAPKLDSSIIAPAPNVSGDQIRAAPSLSSTVIAPASARVSRDQARSAPALNGSVIPPAPASVSHEVSPSPVQMNNVAVVPPPVSAPERESSRTAKLTLPAPSVVAPPPSADSPRDLRRLESGSIRSSAPNVVPPPPTPTANGSFVSSIIGKLFGTQDVVPPPPAVSTAAGTSSARAGGSGNSLAANVIPPPPSVGGSGARRGASSSGRSQAASNVIPPPPAFSGASSGTGSSGSPSGRSQGTQLGASNVIPPPPSVSGQSGNATRNSGGSGNGGLLATNIIPPPPSAGSGSGLSGSGRKGSGLGGPGDIGSALAPPKGAGGNTDNSGVMLSTAPGSKPGKPDTGGKGSLAISPAGGDKPGLGGSGGGSGIGTGTGPGSGLTEKTAGENPGAGKSGTGHGSDPNARAGISPTPGPGGAGTAPTGSPAAPGVDVRGGSTIVTLPSFDAGNSNAPSVPGRSSVKGAQGPAITIVATSRSGGAFDFYGKLPGDNYSVYVDTTIGTVVMQFAEADPNTHPHAGALTGPQGIRTDLPANLPHARVVIKCKLDASGNLKNLQVLEPGPAAMTAQIMAALTSWKFRPATRGAQPVEVNALLGFNIDTNDRH